MKHIHFVSILMLLFMGCSGIYTLQNYPSKQKFYEDFNNFAKNKNLKVTLNNDSSFVTQKGTKISNDSLIFISIDSKTEVNNIPQSIPINKIKDVHYKLNWPGIFPGLILGIPLGIIISVSKIIPANSTEGSPPRPSYDYITSSLIGFPLGIIIGGTAGYFIGFNYTYVFNH